VKLRDVMPQIATMLDLTFCMLFKSNFEICFRSVIDMFGFDLTGDWWMCYINEAYLYTWYLVA
jgi:hypothetical protein